MSTPPPRIRDAACACGQLRITLKGDPKLVGLCHCQQCQRRTGSLFGVVAFFDRGQLVGREGADQTWSRVADSGATLTYHFCPSCGGSVFWDRDNQPDVLTVAVGAFADPDFPPPNRSVWTQSQHRWLALPADLPAYPKAPAAEQPDGGASR